MSNLTLEERIKRLEARAEIIQLAGAYCVSCDDRDLDRLRSLFTSDAQFISRDGTMTSSGVDRIVAMYEDRFKALGPTFHWSHDHSVAFDGKDANLATGVVTGHVESSRGGRALVAGLRYNDEYRCVNGVWKFSKRELGFLYYLPVDEYAEGFSDKLRQRAYGDRRPADYPECVPTWVEGRYAP